MGIDEVVGIIEKNGWKAVGEGSEGKSFAGPRPEYEFVVSGEEGTLSLVEVSHTRRPTVDFLELGEADEDSVEAFIADVARRYNLGG